MGGEGAPARSGAARARFGCVRSLGAGRPVRRGPRGAAPCRMRGLVGAAPLGPEYNARLDGYVRPGMTLKVNLALADLPRFTCLPEPVGQHRTTTHLLPEENVLDEIVRAFREAR